MIERACEWCGATYRRRPDRPGRYCSKACRNLAAVTAAERVCETCGKVFRKNLHAVARGAGRYCSMACRPGYGMTVDARFWRHVRKTDECWVWEGALDKGYGVFARDGHPTRATHFALELVLGRPLLAGHIAAHHCDNPPCVRPDHLFETTHAGNVADKVAKGRARGRIARGEDNNLAKLTAADVLEIRRRSAAGETSPQIAKDFDVDYTHICKIVRRKVWAHI